MNDLNPKTFCDCDECSARADRRASTRENQAMKIIALSDQHGLLPDVPACDLLLIAGDLCPATNHDVAFQARWLDTRFCRWLLALTRNRHVGEIVGIAGNHDFVFQQAPHLIPKGLPWTYLQDSGCEANGLKLWGTPWQPVFFDWAFNGTPEVLKEKWAFIPQDTDVLIVHGPPRGFGDLTTGGVRTGCPHLLERIQEVRPKLVVYGHIHEARGRWALPGKAWNTTLANVTLLDERYRHVHRAMAFEAYQGPCGWHHVDAGEDAGEVADARPV